MGLESGIGIHYHAHVYSSESLIFSRRTINFKLPSPMRSETKGTIRNGSHTYMYLLGIYIYGLWMIDVRFILH